MAKPVKIKRYKRTVSGQSTAVLVFKRYAPMIALAVVLIAVGFLAGRPVLNFISGLADRPAKTQQDYQKPAESPVDDETGDNQPPRQRDDVTPPAVDPTAKRVYYYASVNELSGRAIDATIQKMQQLGADRCVFDLKDKDGYLLYSSQNQYGSQLVADRTLDIALLNSKFSAAGIVPVARIYTFRDNMISTVERSTAVMFRDTDTRWLDSSAALGGKAWANPASEIMRQYIIDITDEIMSLGINEIIYTGFSTPTGYSLADRGFGASEEQLLGHIRTLVNTLKGRISAKGGYAVWEFEYSAVVGGDWRQYIVHPYRLETDNIIVNASGDIDIGRAVDTLKSAARQGEVRNICLWIPGMPDTQTQRLGSYFVN